MSRFISRGETVGGKIPGLLDPRKSETSPCHPTGCKKDAIAEVTLASCVRGELLPAQMPCVDSGLLLYYAADSQRSQAAGSILDRFRFSRDGDPLRAVVIRLKQMAWPLARTPSWSDVAGPHQDLRRSGGRKPIGATVGDDQRQGAALLAEKAQPSMQSARPEPAAKLRLRSRPRMSSSDTQERLGWRGGTRAATLRFDRYFRQSSGSFSGHGGGRQNQEFHRLM